MVTFPTEPGMLGLCRAFEPHPEGAAGPPVSAGQAVVPVTVMPMRAGLGFAFSETSGSTSHTSLLIFLSQD